MSMSRVWSELWTQDNALHIAVGVPLVPLLQFLWDLPSLAHGAALYGLLLYLREVVQMQCRDKWARSFAPNGVLITSLVGFRAAKMRGHKFWWLDLHHWAECLFPTAVLYAVASILDFYIR